MKKMNWLHELEKNNQLQNTLISFLMQYGLSGLEDALLLYVQEQEEYICKNKISTSKIKIHDILYLKIEMHHIYIHTENNVYEKYGTLNNELKILSSHNFIRCSQSCIVSLSKIKTIQGNNIILINNKKLHMSRNYAPKVIAAFTLNTL